MKIFICQVCGHIAFNDPAFADFNDPEYLKVVEMDIACRKPKTHRLRLMPRRSIMVPPTSAPAIIAHMPKIFTTVPISVFVKPISR